MIKGSINLPAMSVYATIPRLYKLFVAAGIKNVVWFCCESLFLFSPYMPPRILSSHEMVENGS